MKGWAALLFAACASAAPLQAAAQENGDPAAAAAAQRVQEAEQLIDVTGQNVNYANDQKVDKSEELNAAMRRVADLKWRPISRHYAKKKAQRVQEEYNSAVDYLRAQESSHMQSGEMYLNAEEEYRAATGSYSNPEQVRYWRTQLAGNLGEEVEEVAQDEPLDTGAVAQQTRDFSQDLGDILKGGLSGDNAGKLMAKAKQMGRYNDSVMSAVSRQTLAGQASARPAARGGIEASPRTTGISMQDAAQRRRTGALTDHALRGKILLSAERGIRETTAEQVADSYHDGLEAARRGDAESALRAADFIIDKDPRNFRGYQLRAKAFNSRRKFKEALAAADTALELNPNDTASLREKAWAELHLEDYRAAEDTATRMIQLDPESAIGYLLRAFAREKLGDRKGMLADLRRAAELDGRYKGHLAKALADEPLFNPHAEDSLKLLAGIDFAFPAPARKPLVAAGLGLLGLAGVVLLLGPLKKLYERLRPRIKVTPMELGKQAGRIADRGAIEPAEDLLAGKYRLDRVIGKGGMGKVWQGWDVSLERSVAVKQTVSNVGEIGSHVREIYLKEATTLARLNHPNIVNIFDALDRQDGVFLVFEFVQGKTAQQLIAEKKRISWQAAKEIIGAVCEGLQFAHDQGFIHRDLKPANIMITEQGYVKIMDFGIAHALSTKPVKVQAVGVAPTDALTDRTRSIAGTPTYMSPEAHQGVVAPSIDIFALGVCLYEFLTARYPFGRGGWSPEAAGAFVPVSRVVAGLPRAVDQLIADALDADYTKRIASAKEFKRRLEEL